MKNVPKSVSNVPKSVASLTIGAKDLKDRRLSDEDRENISTLRKKQDLLCDQVRMTASGYSNGLYVYGSPGTGKTFSVTSVLRQMGNNPVLCNSELSARGLFETFRDNPDGVILIDDVHSCVTDQKSRQVMLAGFGGDIGQPRVVTYTTAKGRQVARFRGSGIVISNLRLRNDPTSKAITSRMGSFEYDPTPGELLSMMKLICLQGKDGLNARDCFEVLTFIEQSGKSFDLRAINKGLSLRPSPGTMEPANTGRPCFSPRWTSSLKTIQ